MQVIIILVLGVAPVSLWLHEWGHVLPALIFKANRADIRLGTGRYVGTIRTKNVYTHIHLVFFHGAYSACDSDFEFTMAKKACISLGGPSINGLAALATLCTSIGSMYWGLELFGWFNAYLAIVNAVPFKLNGKKSDGYRILQFLTS